MDHPWRPPPPPPIPGNICPICSISHFPFCPPPPFVENPRFHHSQSHTDYLHQRPLFEPPPPFPNHQDHNYNHNHSYNHSYSYNYNYNYNYSPGDASVDRRPTWYGGNPSPSLDVSPYHPVGESPVANGSYGYEGYGTGGVKRMRTETNESNRGASGLFMGGEALDTLRSSSHNERILKLIHDHGSAANAGGGGGGGLSQVGEDLFSESKLDGASRYGQERFGESCEVRDDMGLKRRRETSDFHNVGVGSFKRKEPSFYVGPGSGLFGGSREDYGVVSARNNLHYDQGDEHRQSRYGRVENSMRHSLDYSRYGGQPAGRATSTEQSEQTWDHHKGGAPCHSVLQISELKQEPPLPHYGHDPTTETLRENYHNLQQMTPSQSTILKDSAYSHLDYKSAEELTIQRRLQPNHNFVSPPLPRDVREPVDVHSRDGVPTSVQQPPYGWLGSKGHFPPSSFGANFGPREFPHAYSAQPPLPASPPPPPPIDPPRNHFFEPHASPPTEKPSLFPIAVSSSADLSSSHPAIPETHSSVQAYHTSKAGHHASILYSAEEIQTRQSSKNYVREVQPFPLRHISSEKSNIIDASHIFKQPHRAARPDHLVIILRGLPGSGKSYLAKMLRDLEVENGGEAPRIHSMDEYFMTEVEKADDSELLKSSGSLRSKRPVMKKVMEYCYEPEMEEAYRASMLKAFKKTLDEGVYSFIIVDDRNLRVADFAQFWATAKRSGYEVYLLEAAYKDPVGCAARNVHNFTLDDIKKMAGQWEEAPPLYLKMDIKSLLHGDGFDESGIQEVDMDMEDEDAVDTSQGFDIKSPQSSNKDQVDDFIPQGSPKDTKHPVAIHPKEVNHLSKSKWSDDLDGSESQEAEGRTKNASALSGLIQAYSKDGKSVSWGDQGGNAGFSISATRKTNARSLIIGPGSGYNLKSNPLSEEDNLKAAPNAAEPRPQNVFQERIRAESESFKAVFDKRRQRIGGFNGDEE